MPLLEDFRLNDNRGITTVGALRLADALNSGGLRSLRILALGDCSIGDEGAAALARAVETGMFVNFPHLKLFEIQGNAAAFNASAALQAAAASTARGGRLSLPILRDETTHLAMAKRAARKLVINEWQRLGVPRLPPI